MVRSGSGFFYIRSESGIVFLWRHYYTCYRVYLKIGAVLKGSGSFFRSDPDPVFLRSDLNPELFIYLWRHSSIRYRVHLKIRVVFKRIRILFLVGSGSGFSQIRSRSGLVFFSETFLYLIWCPPTSYRPVENTKWLYYENLFNTMDLCAGHKTFSGNPTCIITWSG